MAVLGPGALTLDHIGRAILGFLDYRVAALLTGLLVLVLSFFRRLRGTSPTLAEIMQAAIGLLSIFTGTVIGAVFLLTKPPAIDLLSADSLGLVGLVTVFCTFYLGLDQLRAFFPARPAPPRTDNDGNQE